MPATIYSLLPLQYHKRIRSLLKREYADVWNWFSSVKTKAEYHEKVELELLKTTYRMEREAHQGVYGLVDEVCQALTIEVPVTLYQAQGAEKVSAALYFTPDHGHVVLYGGIIDLLSDLEMKALLAHELAHFKLWDIDEGEYFICDQILTTMAYEPRAETCHLQSARLFQLYTEVYADRGALSVVSTEDVASMLLKVHTGLKQADATSYMKQAEDIFSKDDAATEGYTHPELYIRVRAIQLMQQQGVEEGFYEQGIQQMIEGKLCIDEVDMLGQGMLEQQTKAFLQLHLQRDWLRSEGVLAHVGHFFPDLNIGDRDIENWSIDFTEVNDSVQDYFAYLLIDLVAVDTDLEENAVAAAMLTADKVGIYKRFEILLNKELKILKKDIKRIFEDAEDMVKRAAVESLEKGEEA